MWEVTIEQMKKWAHSSGEYSHSVHASFESVEDAQAFATLAIKSCERSTVTITYEESNYEKKEEVE